MKQPGSQEDQIVELFIKTCKKSLWHMCVFICDSRFPLTKTMMMMMMMMMMMIMIRRDNDVDDYNDEDDYDDDEEE